ncbi:hypothetical protein FPZ24_00560 [Sphingomonas panacisoli]|uniref:Uncharacterized protein n=1 Tax=Sphingomonas panacisoli TaxID=1813879 RepID=A0A5B8LDZ6_9SPHN|nr:hypothetical protein [Sphingomonas panacisoli]QDZ06146.1 hypothetical protein FPZ24_00560 [Sphingomonas panacisoli]
MDLIDRYLSAIRWNLPRGSNAEDILAELRDVIGNRIEEREDALGRPLDEKEVGVVLRDFGHPLVVAARYGTQQWLIGPDLFPFYWFALKVVLAISVLLTLLSGVGDIVAGGHPLQSLAHVLGGAWWSLLGNAGFVTLIFAIIERTGWLTDHLGRWSPEHLPDLGDLKIKTKPQSQWESVFEVVVGIGIIAWWAGFVPLPIAYTDVKGLTLVPDPIWTVMWLPILVLLIARTVFNLVQWLRPRWKAVRGVLSVGTAAAAIGILVIVYQAGHWVTATSATMPAGQIADIDRSTNLGIHYALIVGGVIWVLQCGKELWRIAVAKR